MRSGFFNDTEVWAEDFAEFAAGILTNGVLANTETALKVTAGTAMTVQIDAGYCWINGHFGHAQYTEGIELATADGSLPRADRIVARLDMSTNAVYLQALEGTPAADPTPPSVRRDGTYYDLSLAIVTIPAGTLTITDAMITDTRRDDATCGGVFPNLSSAFIWPSANNIGDIKMFAGAAAPQKWLICDGSAIRRDTYAALFSVIGTTYGAGNGETTFNIPDLRGRVGLGVSSDHALGTRGGAEEHALTVDNMPSHTHTLSVGLNFSDYSSGGNKRGIMDGSRFSTGNISSDTKCLTVTGPESTGGGQAFETMDPFVAVNYIIYTGV
jgi:microcystin-dependent protein